MSTASAEFRKQINEVWKQAIDQLETVKKVVLQSTDRFEADLERLRLERDKLLKRLGEQTYRLVNEGRLPIPSWVKETVDSLNVVVQNMVRKSRSHGSKRKKKVSRKTRKSRRRVR
jgi:hypothetical protein